MIDSNILFNKIIKLLRDCDSSELTSSLVRERFSLEELKYIIEYNSDYHSLYASTFREFFYKILKIDGLVNKEEAEMLIKSGITYDVFFEVLDDDTLLSLLDYNPNFYLNVVPCLSSDQKREELLLNTTAQEKINIIVSNFESDDYKIKHLKKAERSCRASIVRSLKSDYFKEKYLNFYSFDKATIIESLSTDKKKIFYFKIYKVFFDCYARASFFCTFEDPELIYEYAKKYYHFETLYFMVRTVFDRGDKELAKRLLGLYKNKRHLVENILYCGFDLEETLTSLGYTIESILENRDSIDELPDEYKVKYIDNYDEKKKIELIDYYVKDGYSKLLCVSKLKKLSNILKIIDHLDYLPNYSDEFESLIDRYAQHFNLNKEHLIVLCKKFSMSVLKLVTNKNIRKILNSNDADFEKVISLIDPKDNKLTLDSLNDVLNSLLQRTFRLAEVNNTNILNIFPSIMNGVEDQDKARVIDNIKLMNDVIDIDSELEKNGYTLDNLADKLLLKEESAINYIHRVCTYYIREQRNSFVRKNMPNAIFDSVRVFPEKNSLMKYMFSNLPFKILMEYMPSKENLSHYLNNDLGVEFTPLEIALIENEELFNKIIKYKHNPQSYSEIPDDVKANMKVFNSFFEKYLQLGNCYKFNVIPELKKRYEPKEVTDDFMLSLLMNIDLDKIKTNIFSNSEIYEKLKVFLNRYKIVGWGNNLDKVFDSAKIMFDAELLSNVIQYFDLIMEELENKKEKGEIANISLTAILDLAGCYSTECKKYSILFGTENFKCIASNPGPNSSSMDKQERINKSIEKLKIIRERTYVTVPPMDKNIELSNGKKINVVVGNSSNPINLTLGERTGACMRIGGAGDSLYNFCLNDENGFHIIFNNLDDEFVSRVSGFRNGNTVFLNQLRSSTSSKYTNKDLVEACRLIAQELIEQSKNSPVPIDNVVISGGYAMSSVPMPEVDLGVSNIKKGLRKFYSDVTSSSIVLATSASDNSLVPVKLGNRGVKKYLVQRLKKKLHYGETAIDSMEHIIMMDKILNGESIDEVEISHIEDILFCYTGDDWYVSVSKEGKVEQYIMNNSTDKEKAMLEVQSVLEELKINLENMMKVANQVSLGM